MKILYAIKDKYRGAEELVTWEGVPGTVAAWDNKYDAKSELPYLGDEAEVVPLLVLPTEPCEWCDVNDGAWCATYDGRMIALDNEGSPETLLAENWSFCPNCGRRLA